MTFYDILMSGFGIFIGVLAFRGAPEIGISGTKRVLVAVGILIIASLAIWLGATMFRDPTEANHFQRVSGIGATKTAHNWSFGVAFVGGGTGAVAGAIRLLLQRGNRIRRS